MDNIIKAQTTPKHKANFQKAIIDYNLGKDSGTKVSQTGLVNLLADASIVDIDKVKEHLLKIKNGLI